MFTTGSRVERFCFCSKFASALLVSLADNKVFKITSGKTAPKSIVFLQR